MNTVRSVKPAKGAKGFIMHGQDIDGGKFYFFRVYDKGHIHKFVDYDITHHDLEVQILGTDAMLYRSEFGDYIDYPTWKEDRFTPVYREPVVAKTLTDAEFDNIFANGKRLGVLETEDRFRKAMNLTDEEIKETLKIYYPRNADNHINDLVWFARAILRKATRNEPRNMDCL
jgi:hypothetical protein